MSSSNVLHPVCIWTFFQAALVSIDGLRLCIRSTPMQLLKSILSIMICNSAFHPILMYNVMKVIWIIDYLWKVVWWQGSKLIVQNATLWRGDGSKHQIYRFIGFTDNQNVSEVALLTRKPLKLIAWSFLPLRMIRPLWINYGSRVFLHLDPVYLIR